MRLLNAFVNPVAVSVPVSQPTATRVSVKFPMFGNSRRVRIINSSKPAPVAAILPHVPYQ